MGSAFCCGGASTTAVVKKDHETSLTGNRRSSFENKIHKNKSQPAEGLQQPIQQSCNNVGNLQQRQPQQSAPGNTRPDQQRNNRGSHNHSPDSSSDGISVGNIRSPVIPREMMNDPRIQQLMGILLNNGKDLSESQHIDIYDPEAMKKLEGLQIAEDGLAPYQIDSIIPTEFSKKPGSSTIDCNICLVDFEDGDMVKILQCLHTYHQKCIDEWLAKKSVCPDCKFNLRILDIDQFV